jgi:hypothetical protein
MRRLIPILGIMLAAGLVGLGIFWMTQANRPAPVTQHSIVLVSGRDDHGLQASKQVLLYPTPGDPAAGGPSSGALPDGTFARVLEVRGSWLHIASLANPALNGWVDDFYLRSRALRLDGGGQVEFYDARLTNGQVEIAVRPVGQPDGPLFWLPASRLREVGAQSATFPALV